MRQQPKTMTSFVKNYKALFAKSYHETHEAHEVEAIYVFFTMILMRSVFDTRL